MFIYPYTGTWYLVPCTGQVFAAALVLSAAVCYQHVRVHTRVIYTRRTEVGRSYFSQE